MHRKLLQRDGEQLHPPACEGRDDTEGEGGEERRGGGKCRKEEGGRPDERKGGRGRKN